MKCIFNDAVIWATLRHHFSGSLDAIAAYESRFETTINRSRISILDVSKQARPLAIDDEEALIQAMRQKYSLPIKQDTQESLSWVLPPGAYAKTGCGPS